MADVKISELPAASSAAGTDELPANQAGTTRKLTRAQIVDGLAASGAVTSSGLTMTTARLLGRTTGSTGAVEEISVGSGLTLSAGALTAEGGAGSWTEISRATASNTATVDFTGLSSAYDEYLVTYLRVVPVVNGDFLAIRTSTNNGSSYDSGASDYATGKGSDVPFFAGEMYVNFSTSIGFDAKDSLSGETRIYGLGTTGVARFLSFVAFRQQSNFIDNEFVHGYRDDDTAINAIRIFFDAGNIASGTFVLLGRRK